MAYFPLFVPCENRPVLVVGGGVVATRRVKVLLDFGCQVTVVAPRVTQQLTMLACQQQLSIFLTTFQEVDLAVLQTPWMVLAATGDWDTDELVRQFAIDRQAYINVAGCKEKSNFYFPGIVTGQQVVIGVTAQGQNHKLAGQITRKLKDMMEQGELIE